MLNTVKNRVRTTTIFVSKHRVAIAITATTAVMLKLNKMAQREQIEFIKAHDLYDEFLLEGSTEEDRLAFYGE